MTRSAWTTAEQLAQLLEQQRDALAVQITALRQTQDTATPDGRAMYLLCDYLVTGNALRVAQWANDMGWRAISQRTGRPIDYAAKEIVALVATPPAGIPIELVALCRRNLVSSFPDD